MIAGGAGVGNYVRLALLLCWWVSTAHAAEGRFVGSGAAITLANKRDIELSHSLTFVDPAERQWTVAQGTIVDGACVPRVLSVKFGGPLSGKYRKASIVYDHFCQTMIRPWQEVHRMLFDATFAEGKDAYESKLIYAAIHAWGPRWEIIDGKPVRRQDSPRNPSEMELQSLEEWIKATDPSLQDIERYADKQFPRATPLAETRVALVVGNSAYQFTPQLLNPKNDASDVGAALKALGYEVIVGVDLDKAGMDRAIRDFARVLKNADAGVFFYAGHGIQVSGHNYLVPVDAKLEDASGLDFEMVRVDLIQRTMERETSTNILFLDACRDNPLARNLSRALGTRSVEVRRGLAAVESGSGTLIAFSTQPGNVALDGAGRNSPFSEALVKRLKPGASNEDLSRILISVRNDVMAATKKKQVPWENSALTRPFYIGSPPLAASPVLPDRTPVQKYDKDMELAFWQSVKDSKSANLIKTYTDRYPDGHFAGLARALIEQLKKEEDAKASIARREVELKAAETAAAKAAEEAEKARIAKEQLEKGKAEAARQAEEVARARAALQKAQEALEVASAERQQAQLDAKQAKREAEQAKNAQRDVIKEAEEQAKEIAKLKGAVAKKAGNQEEKKKAAPGETEQARPGPLAFLFPGANAPPGPKVQPPPSTSPGHKGSCDGVWVLAQESLCIKPGSGSSFRDCPSCPEMVVIPAGEFLMGSDAGDSAEKPVRRVVVAAPIAVGKFEVTFAEWDACVEAGGCKHKPDDKGWGRGRRPVIDVSWDHTTKEYLPWLVAKTGKPYRLLSEAEWEYAARAGSTAAFPWGNDVGKNNASCSGCGQEQKRSLPVGSFAPNRFGIHDMHGNVYEQTQDCWNNSYQGAPNDASPRLTGDCKRHVIRGGSWFTPQKYLRSSARDADSSTYKNSNVGFRLARDL